MGISTDRQAFADCYGYFERALETPQGIQKWFGAYPPAAVLRARLNQVRTLDKKLNRSLYPPEDPMHGSSIYAQIRVRIFAAEDGGWWLQLLKVSADAIDKDDGWEEIGKDDEPAEEEREDVE
jgi:hypothetical protein